MAPPSTPGKTPTKEMFDTIVNVVVGEGSNQKLFKLHKGILCHYSGYFDKALNGGFKEGRKGTVDLPTENVDTFSHFVLWLYRGIVQPDMSLSNTLTDLVKLWIFADSREIPLLMNVCLDVLKKEIVRTWTVPTYDLERIYDNTTPSSGLRRFAIHAICSTFGIDKEPEPRLDWPKEAMWDMLCFKWDWEKSKKLDKEAYAKIDVCQFHQHEEGVSCKGKR
ncbi:hypothetical protein PRZ48_005961 [Zasmidium cellare]|uniref:BTB domain-containing protein n=1 Tax=Zasmidium cellare TaxID=395010 RepID=A0ABR0EMZ7_ZASCE|nr:hypothetical protein PRZ48_005961 [Zasmidium cellare]